jgi:hypothetical protein
MAGEGGYTITHSEDGEAVHTTVVMPQSHKNTVKVHMAKPEPIKLIYCNKFTESKPVSFHIDVFSYFYCNISYVYFRVCNRTFQVRDVIAVIREAP